MPQSSLQKGTVIQPRPPVNMMDALTISESESTWSAPMQQPNLPRDAYHAHASSNQGAYLTPPPSASVYRSSTDARSSNGQQQQQQQSQTKFVYPGSRSVARPSAAEQGRPPPSVKWSKLKSKLSSSSKKSKSKNGPSMSGEQVQSSESSSDVSGGRQSVDNQSFVFPSSRAKATPKGQPSGPPSITGLKLKSKSGSKKSSSSFPSPPASAPSNVKLFVEKPNGEVGFRDLPTSVVDLTDPDLPRRRHYDHGMSRSQSVDPVQRASPSHRNNSFSATTALSPSKSLSDRALLSPPSSPPPRMDSPTVPMQRVEYAEEHDDVLRRERPPAANRPSRSKPAATPGKGKGKLDTYPLNPYETVLLKLDHITQNLLTHLTSTPSSPSFHNYTHFPPSSVLDLGCGEGHYLLTASLSWAGYGTKVTGLDAVDISRSLWPKAEQMGVKDCIRFVKSNFLREPLPFPNSSFDLVRMSNLALAVPASAWSHVLNEACRVLTTGGRLEIVDDDFLVFPHSRQHTREESQSDATARDLETLFAEMLKRNYGVHSGYREFIEDMLASTFGHARLLHTFDLSLPSSLPLPPASGPTTKGGSAMSGLVVNGTRTIPLSETEVELHASKNPRVLLSCKRALVDYVSSLNMFQNDDDEALPNDEDDGDVDIVLEAVWEYERSLPDRCTPPAPAPSLPVPSLTPTFPEDSLLSSSGARLRTQTSASALSHQSSSSSLPPSYRQSQQQVASGAVASPLGPVGEEEGHAAKGGTHVRTIRVWEAIKMHGL